MVKRLKGDSTVPNLDFEKLNREIVSMRKELDDVKEIIRGLIRAIMNRDGDSEENEFN